MRLEQWAQKVRAAAADVPRAPRLTLRNPGRRGVSTNARDKAEQRVRDDVERQVRERFQ